MRVTDVRDRYVLPLGDRAPTPPTDGETVTVSVYDVDLSVVAGDLHEEATTKQVTRRITTLIFITPSLIQVADFICKSESSRTSSFVARLSTKIKHLQSKDSVFEAAHEHTQTKHQNYTRHSDNKGYAESQGPGPWQV